MESYLDFFQKTMKAPPLLDANLNQKMKTYMEQNLPLCLSLRRK
jgi:hypothetical protein